MERVVLERAAQVSVLSDLLHAARGFARTPGLALALVMSIAIGVGSNAVVLSFTRGLSQPRLRSPLIAASLVLFLVACANVAALLLSRASGRSYDTSIRLALGATRGRLTRQLLAEAAVIAMCGTVSGLLVAWWTNDIVPALFFEEDAESLVFAFDATSVAIGTALCVVLITVCGLLPLRALAESQPAAVLRREAGGLSNANRRLRAGLIVLQLASCFVLLVTAGQLAPALQASLRTPAGNRLAHAIVVTIEYQSGFNSDEDLRILFNGIETTVLAVTGVRTAAWTSTLPGGRATRRDVRIEPVADGMAEVNAKVESFPPEPPADRGLTLVTGRTFGGRDRPGTCPSVLVNESAAAGLLGNQAVGRAIIDSAGREVEVVGVIKYVAAKGTSTVPTIYYYRQGVPVPVQTPGQALFRIARLAGEPGEAQLDANLISDRYLELTGTRVVSGHAFEKDLGSLDCPVAMVDDEAERTVFGGQAVGRVVFDAVGGRITIVGVVHREPIRATLRRSAPSIFYPIAQSVVPRMSLILETSDSTGSVLDDLRSRLTDVVGAAGNVNVRTLDSHLARTALAPERIATVLVQACAAGAVALCIVGVYGVMSDSVRQRRREIAVRVMLGATWKRVGAAVFGEGLRLAAVGAAVGGVVSIVATWWLSYLLPSEPGAVAGVALVWLVAPILLGGVVVAGGLVPALRALTADPLVVLRRD